MGNAKLPGRFTNLVSAVESQQEAPETARVDQNPLGRAAGGFFAFAIITILAAIPFLRTETPRSHALVWIAFIAALGGMAGSSLVARRAERLLRERAFTDPFAENWSAFAVFVGFLALYSVTMYPPSPYDAHVRQAFAFIHGHTYIDAPIYIEHAQFQGRSYQLHPPLPAILLMPFVAIWGADTSQSLFAVAIGALDLALTWRMLARFKLTVNARVWLTIFFGVGTILWYEAINGGSWGLTMLVAVGATVLALDETFGPARPVAVGVLAGLAALARYDLAFVWPLFIVLTYLKRRTVRELVWMAPGFALTAAIYVGLNEARYGSMFDRGVFVFAPPGSILFSLSHLHNNLYTLLFMAPMVNDTFPYIHPIFGGQALVLTSPAFLLAFRPSLRRMVPAILLLATLISITPSLFYFTNGFSQFGTRHYIHAFPFLLAMIALGLPDGTMDQLSRILIGYSVLLIAFGVWHVGMYGFG
jgi:hypothetical protein